MMFGWRGDPLTQRGGGVRDGRGRGYEAGRLLGRHALFVTELPRRRPPAATLVRVYDDRTKDANRQPRDGTEEDVFVQAPV